MEFGLQNHYGRVIIYLSEILFKARKSILVGVKDTEISLRIPISQ
jgi:hypothetical protein